MTLTNKQELAASELEPNRYELLTPDIDPLQLAIDAIQKLRDAGLPTYIADSRQLYEPAADNVAYIEDFRNLHASDSGAGALPVAEAIEEEQEKQPSLTPEQQQRIADHQYRAKRVARTVARQWGARHHEYEEVLSDAYVGLVKAAVKYDPRKRHKTATTDSEYFEKSIKGEILRGFRTRYGRENTPIKNKKGQVTGSEDRIRKVKPSVVYGMATADSLEASFNEGNEIQLIETIPSPGSGEEHIIDQISINEELSNLLEGRTVLEKEVLLRRVVLDQTQAEIGKAVGHSQMQISRIINRVAGHLRPGKPKSLKNPSNNP